MPTKVLFCGNYFDNTGWGNAGLMNILALDSAGVTVVPRAISFNGFAGRANAPKRIFELEDNDLSNIDICIQHTLPHLYSYQSGFENVGMYYSETNHINTMLWNKYINLLDRVIVCNQQMKKAAIRSGVTKDIHVVPIAIDYEKYQHAYNFASAKELKTSFNFCFVGDLTKRKNIKDLLTAFHTEFHPSENVNLFLKLGAPHVNSDKTLDDFNALNESVTRSLKIRSNYKNPVIVTGMLESHHLLSIMSQCHVFVCSSFGEAWCIPAMEAMALGLPVIYPESSGMADFAYGWSARTNKVPCSEANDALPEIYTSLDTWERIDIMHLMQIMRGAFESWNRFPLIFEEECKKAKDRASQYSYKIIGNNFKEILCHQLNT